MIELAGQVERVRGLFAGEHLRLVIDAVIAGNSPGRLWVDDPSEPKSALLWDKTHSFYAAGAADNAAFSQAVGELFASEITPYAQAQQFGIFKLAYTSAAWEPVIEAVLTGYALKKYPRVFYRLETPKIPGWREQIPAGFEISEINGTWLTLERLANFERLHEEIASCWPDVADFRARGFGFCIHDEETLAGWCTSEYVSQNTDLPGSEYISADKCGIGIETVEEYGRRGFATLIASAFVECCRERGITPHWDSWLRNTPSVTVAEKVGFGKLEDYAVFFGTYPQA